MAFGLCLDGFHSTLNIQHSTFLVSPSDVQLLPPRPMHARELLLLLLLHRSQERFDIRILFLLIVGSGVGVLFLRMRSRSLLRIARSAGTLLLLLASARQRDLEIALGRRIARPQPQDVGIVADSVIVCAGGERAVAAIEER